MCVIYVVDEPSLVFESEVQQGSQIVPLLIESTVVLKALRLGESVDRKIL